MNRLAAYEFKLRTKHLNSRREFLLDFCKEDFDLTSEQSENENKEDHTALRAEYQSILQQAKRKKLLSLNQQTSNEPFEIEEPEMTI